MYGNHSFEIAKRIADAKTFVTGKKHIVIPDEDNLGRFTIGVPPIKGLSGNEFIENLNRRLREKGSIK